MNNIPEAIITLWSLGGLSLMFSTIGKAIDFFDLIKSTPKQVLFVIGCILIYGPLAFASVVTFGIIAGLFVGAVAGCEWLYDQCCNGIGATIKAWFLK